MLHWQLLHWLKGLSLATRVGIFSCLGHLFLLFALFVIYKGNSVYNVIISSAMINTDAKIVYMPLHRSFKQTSTKAGNGRKTSSSSRATMLATNCDAGPGTTIIKDRLQSKVVPAGEKKNKAKDLKAKKEKIKAKKVEAMKVVEKKKQVEEKKSIPAHGAMFVEASGEDWKEDLKSPSRTTKSAPEIEQKPIAEPKAEVEKPQSVIAAESAPENTVATNVDQANENIVYVGQAEMEALQLQEYIQNEMAAHWTPPAGIRSDAVCVVKIMVSHDGKNNQIILEQPSKILLFDTAARRAAAQLQPPQWAYGKEISITFKP